MTLEKAIEILTRCSAEGSVYPTKDRSTALKLGIEALQLLTRLRDKAEIQVYPMLPSETED